MKCRSKKGVFALKGALYPNNMNAAGVPLVGQTGAQAIKNFDQIIQQLSFEQRLAFEQARKDVLEEVGLERHVER